MNMFPEIILLAVFYALYKAFQLKIVAGVKFIFEKDTFLGKNQRTFTLHFPTATQMS